MEIPKFSVKPLTDHLAVTHDDRTNERIRADSTPPSLRKLKSSSQVLAIRGCKRRGHID
jgi:hypothetical protein